MGDGPVAQFPDRIDEYALLFQGGDDLGRSASLVGHVENHNVGFHMLRRDLD